MKKKFLASALFVAMTPFVANTASAYSFDNVEDAVEYRSAAFLIMKEHFGALQPVVKGQVPFEKEEVASQVAVLNVLATLPWRAFGPGTEGGDASDDIWSDPEGFKAAQEKFLATLPALTAAADEGNLDRLRAAFVDTGSSCKACHDSYRE